MLYGNTGHSLQTYGFTSSCRSKCSLRLPLWLNFFWQMLHVNQVPSLCDFSRCVSSWLRHVKWPEQCLHEYGFASVWIRTCGISSLFVLNRFPQKGHTYGLLLLCTWRLCSCKLLHVVKLLLHREHLYGLSPVWTLMWRSRFPDWLNALSHNWHLYGLSSVWTLMWVCRLPYIVNALSHTWHLYRFSPSWILPCTTRLSDLENRLLQTVHSNSFSPEWLRLRTASTWLGTQHLPHTEHLYLLVWIFIWWRKLSWDEKSFSHWLQVYITPVCSSLCVVKFPFVVNRLSHTVHKYGLGLSPLTSASVLISILTSNILSPE